MNKKTKFLEKFESLCQTVEDFTEREMILRLLLLLCERDVFQIITKLTVLQSSITSFSETSQNQWAQLDPEISIFMSFYSLLEFLLVLASLGVKNVDLILIE